MRRGWQDAGRKLKAYFRLVQLALRKKSYTHAEERSILATEYNDKPSMMTRVNALFQKVQAEKNKPAVAPNLPVASPKQ